MKDDERIKRVEVLYGGMGERYEFVMEFQSQLKLMGMLRMQEKKEILASQILFK